MEAEPDDPIRRHIDGLVADMDIFHPESIQREKINLVIQLLGENAITQSHADEIIEDIRNGN